MDMHLSLMGLQQINYVYVYFYGFYAEHLLMSVVVCCKSFGNLYKERHCSPKDGPLG